MCIRDSSHVDHTLLSPAATWEQIHTLCNEGLRYHTASVCIPPSFVRRAAAYLGGRLPVCTVVGFPNGYHAAAVKAFEACLLYTSRPVIQRDDDMRMFFKRFALRRNQKPPRHAQMRDNTAAVQDDLQKFSPPAELADRPAGRGGSKSGRRRIGDDVWTADCDGNDGLPAQLRRKNASNRFNLRQFRHL